MIKLPFSEFKRIVSEAVGETPCKETAAPNNEKGYNATAAPLAPLMTKYLFHSTNLRGVAALVIFEFEKLDRLTEKTARLKGKVTFNGILLNSSINIDLATKTVFLNHSRHKYHLIIDPSKQQHWSALIHELITLYNVERRNQGIL